MSDSTLHLHRPDLVPTAADLSQASTKLYNAYQDYVKHVSPQQMTIALETCAYILWVSSSKIEVRSAVDFGSGFTSYVLRLVCDDVWSVDDSAEWLEWTSRFLDRHEMPAGHLETWDDYRQRDLKHDLVIYDFSSGEMRDENFEFAVGQLRPGGVGIMDDANHQGHQTAMYAAAKKFGYDLYGLQDWTRDFFRRFAALVVT